MSVPGLVAQPVPPQTQQPATAALAMLRASLDTLSQKLGQTLPATVIGTDTNGLTQLKLGDLTLAVKLSQPLPAGTQVQVTVQPAADGTISLSVQPRVAVPTPQTPAPSVQAQIPAMPTAPVVAMQVQMPAVTPGGPPPAPVQSPAAAPAAMPVPGTSGPVAAPVGPAVMQATPGGGPTAVPGTPLATNAVSTMPVTAPLVTAALAPTTAAPALPQTVPQPAVPAPAATQVAAAPTSAPAVAQAPMPAPEVTLATPSMPAPVQPATVTAPVAPGAAPAAATSVPMATSSATPVVTAQPTTIMIPAAASIVVQSAPLSPTSPPSAPSAAPIAPQLSSAPLASAAVSTTPQVVATQAPVLTPAQSAKPSALPPTVDARASVPTPAAPAVTSPLSASEQPQRVAVSMPATAERPVVPAAIPARPAGAPVLTLSQPAQAAAQQDSIVPLLKNLVALGTKLEQLPKPVAEAAMRLMAAPVVANKPVAAQMLKLAVERSGVFLDPPAKAGTPPVDVKAALLQLRSGLLALLDGGEIAPIAPIGRRPPPPLRDAQPRGQRADGPTLGSDAPPRDAARTLLHQTDAALSRLKLTQFASQPADAVRAAAAAPDFMVELPMVLGAELGLAQLKVERDGKAKGKASERGWRVRFAVSFSAIGEVGAHVALLGKTTNVVVWADQAATADALEAMLPELAPALAARGLTVGSVRLRRGVPEADAPSSGRLMDTLT